MAFDAGMVCAISYELKEKLLGARVEKVYQPEKDELVLAIHAQGEHARLAVTAGANNPKICLTGRVKENPAVPFGFCVFARKHLTGARISGIRQLDFERVIEITLDSRDEMGFPAVKRLYAEIMGKYSNLILTDGEGRILGVLRPVDFTVSSKRQLLVGMKYEMPPRQEKGDPTAESREGFLEKAQSAGAMATDKFITSRYLGISSLVAREIALRSAERIDEAPERVYAAFSAVMTLLKEHRVTPCLVFEGDQPVAYSFLPIKQYGDGFRVETRETVSQVIDEFFDRRDNAEHSRKRASDLFHMVTNARTRLAKKLALQEGELAECEKKEEYKRAGDLITANMHLLRRGMTAARVIDYYDEAMPEEEILLDGRLSPSQNAQLYYRKYNKAKNAQRELTAQMALAKEELAYIDSVADALERAVGQSELDEIRRELLDAGYGKKLRKPGTARPMKTQPYEYVTSGGYRLLCGKNNLQNDHITGKLAGKTDWWFHVKNAPGSHVVLFLDGREEPSEQDFTQAAALAAFHSSLAGGATVPVDYTQVRYIKKPAGAKPGFVTYTTYWTAYVVPADPGKESGKKG